MCQEVKNNLVENQKNKKKKQGQNNQSKLKKSTATTFFRIINPVRVKIIVSLKYF